MNCRSISLPMLRALIVVATVASLSGCYSTPKRDPQFAATLPPAIPPAPQGNGSIYQAGFERSWFENVRARRVGDILVINLVEDTEATQTNTGSVTKSNSTSISNPTLFGKLLNFGSRTLETGLSSDSSFSGDGDNTQNNQFNGSISVTVTEVLSNGYLMIRGEKRIAMTGGNEYIRVSGIVRPEDIDTSNTVDSTKVADATLVYVGDGQVTAASKMGWLARFFASALMPF